MPVFPEFTDMPNLRTSFVREFNPDVGVGYVISYAGTEADLVKVRSYWELSNAIDETNLGYGYKTTTEHTADGLVLTVRVPEPQLFTDRWDLDTEFESTQIWNTERIRSFIPAMAALNLTLLADLKTWMRRIGLIQAAAAAIQSGASPIAPSALAGDAAAVGAPFSEQEYKIMYLMIRDGDYMQLAHPVLKRNRCIPSSYTAARTRLIGPPKVYSLVGLANIFGMPDDIYDQAVTVYDGLPVAPPDTGWGWKVRQDNSETIIGSGKVQERKDFVFGRYSTITHDFVV